MRFLVCGVLLVGCASADPGFGPASPTRPDAPVAEAPSVAHALEDDPAPAPEEGPEDMGHHGHAGHSMGGSASEPEPSANDEAAVDSHEGHDRE